MLETLAVDAERMRAAADAGYTTATAVADTLVRRGIPFRAAHHVVGSLVAQAEEAGVALDAADDAMIGMALGVSGDADAEALAVDPGIGELPAVGGVHRRGAGLVRRHGRDGTRPGQGRPRRDPQAPGRGTVTAC